MQSPEKLKPTLINSMSRRLRKLVLFSNNKPLKTTKFCEFTPGFLRNPLKLTKTVLFFF